MRCNANERPGFHAEALAQLEAGKLRGHHSSSGWCHGIFHCRLGQIQILMSPLVTDVTIDVTLDVADVSLGH